MTRRTSPTLASLAAVVAATVGVACSGADAGTGGVDSSTPRTSPMTRTVRTGASTTTSGTTDPTDVGGGPGTRVSYREFDSCGDLLEWTKAEMLERVTPYGLESGYFTTWRDGEGDDRVGSTDTPTAVTSAAGDESAPAASEPTGAGSGTSTTNTQEAGVDEGDLTETDGRFVYSVLDDRLRSVDLDTETLVSEVELRSGEHQLVLFGERLLVVTQDRSSGDGETIASQYAMAEGVPTLETASHLEGQVVAVRAIDGVVRLVLDQPLTTRLRFVRPRFGGEDEEDAALEENRRVIEAATADQLLPRSYPRNGNGSTGQVEQALPCDEVGAPEEFAGFDLVWVATIDLHGSQRPSGAAGVVASAEATYASATTLYVSTTVGPDLTGDTIPVDPEPPSTHLLAFDLSAVDGADYSASGEVAGELLGQYAMSEHAGVLRVATTTWAGGFGASQESGVHVLERQGASLVEVGALGGLGVGEEIQAVRFLGDIGYVVTFRRVDPLYVLDLANPTAPALVGELKVPGYSTYLHPVGDERLLAIGFTGDDDGLVGDMQLSLFDVSDLATPTLLSTLPLVGWSEAAFDPHGFLYWPATGQVVVPKAVLCSDHIFDCTSAVVAAVSGDELVEQGRLFSWWPIRRSMVADGELVTVSSIGTKIWALDTLDERADIRFDVPDTTADDDLD